MGVRAYKYICVYIYTYILACVNIYMCMYIYMSVYIYIYICVCIYIYVYIYMYIYMGGCKYIYIYIYILTTTHKETYKILMGFLTVFYRFSIHFIFLTT